MKEVKTGGLLVILINKSRTAENTLEKSFQDSKINWKFIEDKYIDYPDFNAIFKMYVIKKE